MTGTRRAAINLAAIVPDLPDVVMPNGKTTRMVPFTAQAYEQYRYVQLLTRRQMEGEEIDNDEYQDCVDDILRVVLPDASRDDLAAFGTRLDLKLMVLMAASGSVEETLKSIEEFQKGIAEGKVNTLPPSILSTMSVASSSDTPEVLDKTL
jgi:hypothetical protein